MIIPSLLTNNKRVAQERINLALNMSGWLHVDVLDHSLYLFESLPISELESLDFGGLFLEFHCMTNNPEAVLNSTLPVERIILHYEMKDWQTAYDRLIAQGIDTWLAIDPATEIDTLDIPADLSGAVLMAVEPGQTGQPFIEATYERMEQFKDYYPDIPLTVDGGVSPDNLRLLLAHGADNMVMGNAIFHTTNPVESYERYVRLSDPIAGASQ